MIRLIFRKIKLPEDKKRDEKEELFKAENNFFGENTNLYEEKNRKVETSTVQKEPKFEHTSPNEIINKVPNIDLKNSKGEEKIKNFEQKKQMIPNTPSGNSTLKALKELDDATKKLQQLEELIDQTFTTESKNSIFVLITVKVHTHEYTGNRLWHNDKCPICRQSKSTFVDEREAIVSAEKEQDRMILHVSLQVDKNYIDQKKVPSCLFPAKRS